MFMFSSQEHHFYNITKWFKIAGFYIYKKKSKSKKNSMGNIYMANIV